MDARLIAPAAAALLGQAGALDAIPLRVDMGRMLFKAMPAVEGGQRVLYMEASTQIRDQQGEMVLTKALQDSIPYFLKYGKIDLDHASMTGEIRGNRVDPYAYEVGRPIDVRVDGSSIYVKASIFQAPKGQENSWSKPADLFWDSLQLSPPVLWYPSVAGEVYSEGPTVDPATGTKTQEIRGLRWHSIGLSRTPVNQAVAPVSLTPLRVFAKAFGGNKGMIDLLRELGMPAPRASESGEEPVAHTITEEQARKFIELLMTRPDLEGLPAVVAAARPIGLSNSQATALLVALAS